jgi:hypothetical protein
VISINALDLNLLFHWKVFFYILKAGKTFLTEVHRTSCVRQQLQTFLFGYNQHSAKDEKVNSRKLKWSWEKTYSV